MPKPIVWTDKMDRDIITMCAGRMSWDVIADHVGVSRYTAIERGRVIGAVRPPAEASVARDDDRLALPAGHPDTWALLTKGSCLQGTEYPLPVFA